MKPCEFYRDLINSYIDNEMTGIQKFEMERHLERCQECKAEYESLKSLVDLTGTIEEVEIPLDFNKTLHDKLMEVKPLQIQNKIEPPQKWLKYISIAATAAVLVIAVRLSFKDDFEGLENKKASNNFSKSETVKDDGKIRKFGGTADSIADLDKADVNANGKIMDNYKNLESKQLQDTRQNIVAQKDEVKQQTQKTKNPSKRLSEKKSSKINDSVQLPSNTYKKEYPESQQRITSESVASSQNAINSNTKEPDSIDSSSMAPKSADEPSAEATQYALVTDENLESGNQLRNKARTADASTEPLSIKVYSINAESCLLDLTKWLQKNSIEYSSTKTMDNEKREVYATVASNLSSTSYEKLKVEIGAKYSLEVTNKNKELMFDNSSNDVIISICKQ